MTKQSSVSLFFSFYNQHCLYISVLIIFFVFSCPLNTGAMEEKKRWQIPLSGNWNCFDEMTKLFGDEALLELPVSIPVKSTYPYCVHCHRKVRKDNGVRVAKLCLTEKQQTKHKSVCDITAVMPRSRRAPMAVDEDLYKIPPELLYAEPKREKVMRNLLWGCMGGLNCIR
ncbi:uncharacterized protein LOC110033015 isoform X2 [Phalaenopsis equestris]|uniref:uncharacterized protein LOC110033014 isoform X2 n=1 Tax=Phalaenopsis equestris TaxID=78828 RepID=UPI0009E3A71E|nr:uncharacterized protein LOC110033014 isoform X2 [Phalaenopsis equestris]XP_020592505.1 uncharacterized protein LOC110033015 isoform X2 [Phalaenopsis equestris]